MTNARKGYGPPSVGKLRVVRIAEQERTLSAGLPGAPAPSFRIEIDSEEEFPLRAMPLMIKIGDRGYLASEVSADGKTIGCELSEIPEEGAVIRVGYPPVDFTELPERFTAAMLDAEEPGPEGDS